MEITTNTILQRVPELRVDISSSNNIMIRMESYTVECGPHGLAVLDAFSQPNSLSDVLVKLQARISGPQDWRDLMSTITVLYKAGVLRDTMHTEPIAGRNPFGYDAPWIHVAMLNDRTRTSSFLAGIREVVRPGDIVVDIGTGTGVLAMAAARSGARHVYAIEATSIGKAAVAMFEANGLADRITLVPGWSTQVSLPERADVLVSEMIGSNPLGERVLEVTADALKRLLKPDARLVPARVKIWGLPLTIPPTELVKRTVTVETLHNWYSWYGLDFGPLAKLTRNAPLRFDIKPYAARDWKTISVPALLADIDFRADDRQLWIDNTTTISANASGQLDGVLVYFELELGPSTRLSTHPAQVEKDNHWNSPVWVLFDPLSVQTGDRFAVTYKHGFVGTQNGVSVSRV